MSRSEVRPGAVISQLKSLIPQRLWVLPLLLLAANPLFADEAAKALQKEVDFRIAAQSVDAALSEFAKQSDVQLMFAAGALGAQTTQGVTGKVTVRQALEELLRGTGLVYEV